MTTLRTFPLRFYLDADLNTSKNRKARTAWNIQHPNNCHSVQRFPLPFLKFEIAIDGTIPIMGKYLELETGFNSYDGFFWKRKEDGIIYFNLAFIGGSIIWE